MSLNGKLTILQTVKRGKWVFRASVFQNELDVYSILLIIYNLRNKNNLSFRFFSNDEDAAAFVDECSEGKYGDILDDYDESKT